MLKEYLQWIYSLFLCFGLERKMAPISQMVMKKKGHLMMWSTITGGGHLLCARACARFSHTAIFLSPSWPFPLIQI